MNYELKLQRREERSAKAFLDSVDERSTALLCCAVCGAPRGKRCERKDGRLRNHTGRRLQFLRIALGEAEAAAGEE